MYGFSRVFASECGHSAGRPDPVAAPPEPQEAGGGSSATGLGDTGCVDPLAPLRMVGGRLAPPAEGLAQAIAERVVGQVVGALDLNALLAQIDVNAVLDQVDIERLLGRVDVNGLLDRVDVDRLLDRVDVDHLMERVDMNAIIQRIDVEALVEQTDFGEVIARSSSGVVSDMGDAVRSRAVGVDESIARLVARLRRRPYTGPPGPPAGLWAGAAS